MTRQEAEKVASELKGWSDVVIRVTPAAEWADVGIVAEESAEIYATDPSSGRRMRYDESSGIFVG